ncbi:NAD+ synthase [Palleronia sp.]|uniref:NAD+ synthase n=1 Tax=Palleronia sp. TaxID=1940284 RepID=UPI0035C867BF
MTDRFRFTLAQLNPVVGDLRGNAAKARAAWEAGRAAGANLLALPEMFVTGHPVQDLALKPGFRAAAMEAVERLAADCADGPALAIGGPWMEGGQLHDAYWVCQGGRVTARVLKHRVSGDERRLYEAGPISGPVAVGPVRIGFPIGEDAWSEDVAEAQAESGAEILLVPSAAPYHRGTHNVRLSHMVARVVETGLPLACLNMVGGQDEMVFDGASFVLNPGGALARQMSFCDEDIAHVDFLRTESGWRAEKGACASLPDEWQADYRVMVEALRDHVRKSGFSKVLLELSGGLSSALVAAIAADALGPANVRCVTLPSNDTPQDARDAAAELGRLLGCHLDEVGIDGALGAMHEALATAEAGGGATTARLRAVVLMALCDTSGEVLLSAVSKSDIAVGEGAPYGGFAPLKDLYKTRVTEICRWRNANHRPWMQAPAGEVIPPRLLDSLPTKALDDIVEQLVERDASIRDVVARGHDREMVCEVERLIHRGEHLRQQAPPGPRLTSGAFRTDRRYPIVNRWRDPS